MDCAAALSGHNIYSQKNGISKKAAAFNMLERQTEIKHAARLLYLLHKMPFIICPAP